MKELNTYSEELKNYFGERLSSVFIYGSKARLKPEELQRDVNLMIIVKDLNAEDLKCLSKASQKWINGANWFEAKNPAPVFMDKEEWFCSCDVYAMEYSDIKENNYILSGEDLIKDIVIKKEDLRLQCESETKNLLMRFRAHYLQYANSPQKMKESIIPVVKTSIAIFKAILRIKDICVPNSQFSVLDRIAEHTDIDITLYEKLLCYKENHCKLSKKETEEASKEIISELQKLLRFINNI